MAKLGSTHKGDIKENEDIYKYSSIDNSLNIGSYFYIRQIYNIVIWLTITYKAVI